MTHNHEDRLERAYERGYDRARGEPTSGWMKAGVAGIWAIFGALTLPFWIGIGFGVLILRETSRRPTD